jgi:DNA-directed RNA polymerase specialized sigma24 family protein
VDRNQILERLRERIVRFAASRFGGEGAAGPAQDIAQEVLLVLHEKYPALDRVEDLLPLSLEIARFKILAARRKTIRRERTHKSRWTIFRWLRAAQTLLSGPLAVNGWSIWKLL